jgi:hypothetical protein
VSRGVTVGDVDADIRIRPYESRDASGVAEVMFRSVREVAIADYAREQVQAWLPEPPGAAQVDARASDGRTTFVAVDPLDRVAAFVESRA